MNGQSNGLKKETVSQVSCLENFYLSSVSLEAESEMEILVQEIYLEKEGSTVGQGEKKAVV